MTFEPKDLSGSLFRNGKKEKETHPDYNGNCRIDGHDYWISGWLKSKQDGEKFFSLAFKRKDGTAARPETLKAVAFKAQAPTDFGDDVPFEFQWK